MTLDEGARSSRGVCVVLRSLLLRLAGFVVLTAFSAFLLALAYMA